ncbi:MAG: cobalamin-dependent protein [bacterium]|nr:cobalamin-dependent protein [bacterium]
MADFEKIQIELVHALLTVNVKDAEKILLDVSADFSMIEIADNLLAPVFESIGTGWEEGAFTLAQIYMSGRICEQLVDKILKPSAPARKNQPKMAMAVIEDYHYLGKKLILSVLKLAGFEALDYGHGLSTTEVIDRALEDEIEILLLSSLTLPSALLISNMTKLLKLSNPAIKVIVGGTPFNFDKELWKEVGADAMGRNASDAIGIVQRIAGGELKAVYDRRK